MVTCGMGIVIMTRIHKYMRGQRAVPYQGSVTYQIIQSWSNESRFDMRETKDMQECTEIGETGKRDDRQKWKKRDTEK